MGTNLSIALWLLHALVADLIVIEPEGADPALTEVTVDSYRDAVDDVDLHADGSETHWYAHVVWDEPKLHARVELRRGTPDGAIEIQRDVEFSATDDLEQRHRAIGLIIAAHVLADARAREEAARAAAAAAPPATPAANAPPPANAAASAADTESQDEDELDAAPGPARPLPGAGVDVALLAGPALDRGAPAFGMMLRGFVRPLPLPIAGLASLRAGHRFQSPALTTVAATLGLAMRLQPRASAFALELRGEGVVERSQATADSQDGARSDSGGIWRGGGQLGIELHASVSDSVALFAGGELRLMQPAVHVEVEGREIGVEKPLGWDVLCGVRYAR